jgi:Tol biopolymer transport system component
MRATWRYLTAGVTAMLLLGPLGSSPASATYPGKNGRIAFSSMRSGSWQLWTMRPDGGGLKRLTSLPDRDWSGFEPDWSPDGTRILFAYPDAHGTLTIYVVNADGTGVSRLTHGDSGNADWSPDGSKIVLDRQGSGVEAIYTMNADGSNRHRITSHRYGNFDATFTPDGQHIVYSSERAGLVFAIWMMNLDGSGKHRLTPANLRAAKPDVSPDGTHIVFMSNEDTFRPKAIYTMNLDGTDITRLTTPGCCHNDTTPRYSPDGRMIAFATDRNYPLLDGMDIYEMNADGTHLRLVAPDQGACNQDLGGIDCLTLDWGLSGS